MTKWWPIGVGASLVLLTGCTQAGADDRPLEQSPKTSQLTPAPSYAGTIGIPVHANAPDGSTADITLNGARTKDDHCIGELPCLVLDLTITGTSDKPFAYSESTVTWSYAGSPADPWAMGAQPGSNRWGSNPSANYTQFMPPGPLRIGRVQRGETKRGLTMSMIGSPHEPLIAWVSSPDKPAANEAAWPIVA